ncbi:uncharacterized protein LOC121780441 isoform X1 [Salvia splendens]|uniref:uncharacterized protein LOC121780441 isoform X1 n=1 Tax=Salvia splendens TaxID=180675 RepID=UPI001C26BCFA|nr:uncharacterized protein LOC121780441 isoform X1 [Salvia splendens]
MKFWAVFQQIKSKFSTLIVTTYINLSLSASLSQIYLSQNPLLFRFQSPQILPCSLALTIEILKIISRITSASHDQRCGPLTAYYLDPTTDDDSAANERSIPANCGVIQLPIDSSKGDAHQLFDILTAEFFIEWNVSEACFNCFHQGWPCLHNSMNQFIRKKEGTPTLLTRTATYPSQILRKTSTNAFLIHDREIQESLDSSMCYTFIYLDLPESPFVSFTFSPNITFFTCYNQTALPQIQDYFQSYRRSRCEIPTIYYKPPPAHQDHALPTPPDCVLSRLPYKSGNISADPLHLLTADFTLEWSVHQDCYECHHGGGQCYSDNQRQFYCRKKVGRRRQKKEARL